MNKTVGKNLILLSVAVYCFAGWVGLRNNYFLTDENLIVKASFAHLLLTNLALFGWLLRHWRRLRSRLDDLGMLSIGRQIAISAVAIAMIATTLNYPAQRVSSHTIAWGLMASTNALIESVFLACLTICISWAVALNIRTIGRELFSLFERLILHSRQGVFLAAFTLGVFMVTNAISFLYFHHAPASTDGVNYLFQARIFADGRLYAEPPLHPDFFRFVSLIVTDKWYTVYPPGFPLILAIGILGGAPWLVNPTLAALCVPLTFLVARRLYGDHIARGSVALIAVSPFFLLLSSTYLSHTSTAFCFLLFLYFYLRGKDEAAPVQFFLAGLALGGMVAIRPLTGFAIFVVGASYACSLILRKRSNLTSAIALALGLAIPVAGLLAYNRATNGEALVFGYEALYGKGYRLGFGKMPTMSFYRGAYTPLQGIVNLNNGMYQLNSILFGWPLPSLIFAMAAFAVPSKNKWDYILLTHFLAIPIAYFFYFYQSLSMGPRFYFSVVPVAVILTASGLKLVSDEWDRLIASRTGNQNPRHAMAVLICICLLFNFAYYFPSILRCHGASSHSHQGATVPVWKHVDRQRINNAVVFINDSKIENCLAYGSGLWRNSPGLDSSVVYVRDCGRHNRVIMEQYPSRSYYCYDPSRNSLERFSLTVAKGEKPLDHRTESADE